MKEKLLEVKGLGVAFKYNGKYLPQTRDVNLVVYRGEILGLVGESGSGKSVTSKALLQLLPETGAKILGGEAVFEGKDLLKLSRKEMRSVRGNKISMIFQEPMTSLNPVYTCGNQIVEAIMLHRHLDKKSARIKAVEMMKLVGIPAPETRLKNYPHEMSGGMRQRVMIAMALSCNPELLIADEPTTALDPTIQAQIMDLLVQLQRKTGMSVLYISHDMGVIAEICDRVAVMYAGVIMEVADVHDLFHDAWHPYTVGLMKSMPRMNSSTERLDSIEGSVPHFSEMPPGCPFAPRCKFAFGKCLAKGLPPLTVQGTHSVRCWKKVDEERG